MRWDVLGNGTAVYPGPFLWPEELAWAKEPQWESGTRWYRSKDREETPYLPGIAYVMNKKWTLEEEFTVHMLRFQQVIVSSSYFGKLIFVIPGSIDWSY